MAKEKDSAQKTINTIRRKTQRKHSAEEKIRIALSVLGVFQQMCIIHMMLPYNESA